MALGSASNVIVGAASICVTQDLVSSDLGFTDGGITIRYEPEYLDVFADQVKGRIAKRLSDEAMFVEFQLIEMTLDNIRRAMGLPSSNIVTIDSDDVLVLGYSQTCSTDTTFELQLQGEGLNCCTRYYHFYAATPSAGFEISLSRDETAKLSVTFEILKVASVNYGGVFGIIWDAGTGCGPVSSDENGDVCVPATDPDIEA